MAYLDSTVAMPMLAPYVLARRSTRKLKQLYGRGGELVRESAQEYEKAAKGTHKNPIHNQEAH